MREVKKDELREGLRPSGEIIGTYRSFAYQEEKRSKNPKAKGNVDLIDTGSFSDKMSVKSVGKNKFQFQSFDSKATMLFDKYGEDLKSLNQINFNKLWAEVLFSRYMKKLKKISGL